jgi:hypothetical protein
MSEEDVNKCVVQTEFTVSWNREPFQTTLAIENMHSRTPRFRHSSDINLLIEGNRYEQADYLTGLLAASVGFFLFFLLWMCCLVFCKCLGPQRVGFLSAKRQLPSKPEKPKCLKQQQKARKKMPFQHNGIAAGYEDPNPKRSPVKALVRPPTKLINKARETKRKLEHNQELRSKYSKMKSSGDMELEDIIEGSQEDQTSAPRSPGSSVNQSGSIFMDASTGGDSQSQQETYPTTPGPPTTSPEQPPPKVQFLTDDDRKAIAAYEHDFADYRRTRQKLDTRIRRVRVGVGFCAIGIVISSVLFTVMAMDGLSQSVTSAKDGLKQISKVATDTITILNIFQERQQLAQESTQKFILQVNGTYSVFVGGLCTNIFLLFDAHILLLFFLEICPAVAPSLCTNVTSEDRVCDFSEVPVYEELVTLFKFFDGTLDLIFGELEALESDLYELLELLDTADKYYPKHFAWAFWVAAGASLGLGALCLFLLLAIVRLSTQPPKDEALPPVVKFVRSWMVVPLFLLLTCIGWLFSMVFIVASTGTADFCFNSPDGPVLNILAQVGDNFDSIVFDFLIFYVKGCPLAEAPVELDQRIVILAKNVIPSIQGLASAIRREGEANLEQVCGSNLAPFLAIVGALDNQLCILTQTLVRLRCFHFHWTMACLFNVVPIYYLTLVVVFVQADVRGLFSCENWYPIYEETMHNAVCHHATSGFAWASYVTQRIGLAFLSQNGRSHLTNLFLFVLLYYSSTQLVIVVLAAIILTLRIAYYGLDEIVEDETSSQKNSGGGICCCGSDGEKVDDGSTASDDDRNGSSYLGNNHNNNVQ